jgi:hypothetical protein
MYLLLISCTYTEIWFIDQVHSVYKNLVMPFAIRMFEVSDEPLALVAQVVHDTLLRHMSVTNSHSN